jgi:hypothetical protein
MDFDKNAFLNFLWKAHQNTYAAPDHIRKYHKSNKYVLPGFVGYAFSDGEWKYHDSYSGRRWPPGREFVFFKDTPVWTMSYQGKVSEGLNDQEVNFVYSFLKVALRKADPLTPFRGPLQFNVGDFEYVFKFRGDYSYFVGKESVTGNGVELFFQNVMGSIIR